MAELDDIAAGATKLLNCQGHAFEEGVIQHCRTLLDSGQSDWTFRLAECPVDLHGRPHHIDFVLEHRRRTAVMLGECKRVDPSRARWCFVKRQHTSADERIGEAHPVFSTIRWARDGHPNLREDPRRARAERTFHLCLELKTGKPGEGCPPDPNKPHEQAVDQAFRSASGYIERMKHDGGSLMELGASVLILPAIVTTAQLFASETAISGADLQTGKIDGLDIKPVGFVWFQQNLSRHLRPDGVHFEAPRFGIDSFDRSIARRHTRATAIVNVEHLGWFLNKTSLLGEHEDYLDRL
jgi:hypothetical protein